jgi:uncharacterized repeat protein (TIGR03803 family)
LIQDAAGNIYGTTELGGTSFNCGKSFAGCGTVFKIDSSGKGGVIHSFTGADGAVPDGGLIFDKAGNLYGTALYGGDSSCNPPNGCGTLFRIDPSTRKLTVVYYFKGGRDGLLPLGDLTMDAAGNIYGATYGGGLDNCTNGPGCGTIFKVDSTGHETVLYRFTGNVGKKRDGGHPGSGVDLDELRHLLYGTTECGACGDPGTVFELTMQGRMRVLYRFTGGTDGKAPQSGLLWDKAGNLYGTTNVGGTYGLGTVFKVDPAGKETVLHSFDGVLGNPSPNDRLVWDKVGGNLYGTTQWGGDPNCEGRGYGCGNVFKIDVTGKYTDLFDFNYNDGNAPDSGVIRDSSGNLYGTGEGGGVYGSGVVFKLTPRGR